MAYRNLDEFLIRLEQEDDLIIYTSPPINGSTLYETSVQIASQPDHQNHALWFEGINDSPFPVITNIFGTARRMAWALRLEDLTALEQRLSKLLDPSIPNGFGGLMQRAGDFFKVFRSISAERKRISSPQSQEVVIKHAPFTSILPAIYAMPASNYAEIPFAQVITQHNDRQDMHITDVKIYTEDTLLIPKHAVNAMDTLPISTAVVIGGDPATMWCGIAPLPDKIDPYLLAGWVRGKPVALAEGITQKLHVPADAEIIIEGKINTISRDGHYCMTITAITHRKQAVFPFVMSHDRRWLHKAVERLFMPVMRLIMPEVHDMNLPIEYGQHNLALISINKAYHGQAHKVMHGLWGMGQLALLKTIVVVDADVDIQQPALVLERVLETIMPQQDIMQIDGLRYDVTTGQRIGAKIGLDATRKHDKIYTPIMPSSDKLQQHIKGDYRVYGRLILMINAHHTDDPMPTISAINLIYPDCIVIILDNTISLDDTDSITQRILTQCEWSRDIIKDASGRFMGIDATEKHLLQKIEQPEDKK